MKGIPYIEILLAFWAGWVCTGCKYVDRYIYVYGDSAESSDVETDSGDSTPVVDDSGSLPTDTGEPPVGSSEEDDDGDGYTEEQGDCNDGDANAYPGATEVWYDGVDQDCDGESDYDADGDGVDSATYGGQDCNDADDEVTTEPEGTDNDLDDDGYQTVDGDCDDANSAVHPGATEVWYDGMDQNCDGNDADQDGDGQEASFYGGADCNDTDSSVGPGAGEVCDGVDEDCDGVVDDDPRDGEDLVVEADGNICVNGEQQDWGMTVKVCRGSAVQVESTAAAVVIVCGSADYQPEQVPSEEVCLGEDALVAVQVVCE